MNYNKKSIVEIAAAQHALAGDVDVLDRLLIVVHSVSSQLPGLNPAFFRITASRDSLAAAVPQKP